MDAADVRALISASREVTHATANLAAVAASVAPPTERAQAPEATLASMAAAKAAFTLDDIYRRHNGSEESLRAAEAALGAAAGAIQAARDAIAEARRVPIVRKAMPARGRDGGGDGGSH